MKFKSHKNGVVTYEVQNGTIEVYPGANAEYKYKTFNKKGELNSIGDKPAVVDADGKQVWYRDGKRHRDGNKLACIYADGSQFWYRDDKLHRDGDKPAYIGANGTQKWYRDGKFIKIK